MRVVSWNCHMGFRGPKLEALLALAPDLAIVQECSERDVGALAADGFDVIWEGSNPGKGLGVVARPGVSVSLDACHDPELAYFLPLKISSGELDFRLVAVWAFNQRARTAKRWPLNESLAHYEPFFAARSAVIAGDFNNHPVWDTPSRPIFQRSLDVLTRAGLRSAWHCAHGKEHGEEGCGTFHWYRHEDKPYHIDYCFVSSDIEVSRAEIGAPGRWLAHSDHSPIVVDLAAAAT